MTSVADQPVDVVSVPPRSAVAVFRSYLALTKPKIIRQLLVTTVPAMFLAARGLPGLWTVVATLVGGALAAGSANSLNCYVDRDIDQVMTRTARRPLAQHTVAPTAALVFGIALGMVSVAFLWVTTNFLAAVLALAAILFYVLVYTMGLKRRTSQNIVWGGAAGCMPVLIGWAAVTGSLAWPAWVLFAVIFFWTPPHFWALAMKYKDDYAAAGVPMLPVVASPRRVAFEIVAYSWVMVATSLVLWPLATSWIYGVSALLAGVWFLVEAHRLRAQVVSAGVSGAEVNSMRLFHVSISYLTVLFVAVAVDALIS
jgi:protoheme IX farnesyltransferase